MRRRAGHWSWSTRAARSTTGARISTPRSASCACRRPRSRRTASRPSCPASWRRSNASGRPSSSARPAWAARSTSGSSGRWPRPRTGRSSCHCRTRPRPRRRPRSTSCAGATAARSWRPARRSTRSRSTAGDGRSARPTTCSCSRVSGWARSPPRRPRSPTGCSSPPPGRWPPRSSPERIATGALFPAVADLRPVTRAIARVVADEAVAAGLAGLPPDADLDAVIDGAMWWPGYVPYSPIRDGERRRASET